MHRIGGRAWWLVAVAGLVVLSAAAPASAASRQFSLVISTLGPSYSSAAATTGSGQAVTITARVTNESTTQQLGSADLAWPRPVGVLSASVPAPATATKASCTGAVTGPCLQLRNLSLTPGASRTVTMTVQTQACAAGPSTWSVVAKQSNNFTGVGNDIRTLDHAASNLITTLDGACRLAFVTQPHDAQVSQPITGTDWSTSGGPVTVQVTDAGGHAIASSAAAVTVGLGSNPGAGTLSGTTVQTADGTDGTAAFAGLAIDKSATGYTLAVSSGTLNADTSSPFTIQDQVVSCAQGSSCQTSVGTPSNGNSATVAANPGAPGLLIASANANNGAKLVCAGYTSADTNTYQTLSTANRSKVITTTIRTPAIPLSGTPGQILERQQICFGAPYRFLTAAGAPASPGVLPDGSAGYIGLLPNCTASPAGPCHNRVQDTTVTDPSSPLGFDIVLVLDIPAGLPGDPFHT